MNKTAKRTDRDYISSKEAWVVGAWRYNHQTSQDKVACADDTGLPVDTVCKWWDGVDRIYKKSDGAHVHFSGVSTPQKVGGIFKDILSKNQGKDFA